MGKNDSFSKELGSKLKFIRQKKKMSLKKLSQKVECSQSYLSMLENAKANPSVSRLKRITDELGITIIELLQTKNYSTTVIRKK